MQVNSEQIDPCTLELDIVVDEERVDKAFDLTYREFNRNTSVPGFRLGKAPRVILERYVQLDRVKQRAMEKLVSDTLVEVIKEGGYEPIRPPSVAPGELVEHAEFSFKATLPFAPEVSLGDYTGLTVTKPIFKVTEDIIDSRIKQLQDDRTRLEKVTGREVLAGDVLIAEVSETVEGAEAAEPRRRLIQLGNNIPGLDDGLVGMAIDEQRTLDLAYPADYDLEENRGKKVTFVVKLISISAKRAPELNDAFAKEVGEVDTVAELRDKLRSNLELEAVNLSNQVAEQNILSAIVEKSTIFYPKVMVHEEMEEDFKRLSAELRRYKMSYEQFLENNNLTQEQHQQGVEGQAEERLRVVLALREISRLEGLEVNNEAVDAEFERLLESGQIAEEQFEEYKAQDRRRFQIANALVQQHLHEFLFTKNTFNEEIADKTADEALAEVEV